MGILEKRARHKEEFRREILDAAREIFIKDGHEKFSMRHLASRIGYSPTTIYLYFKGKDDLLFAISEEFFGSLFTRLNQIRSTVDDPFEALRRAFLLLVEFGLANPHQYALIFFRKSPVYGTREEFLKKKSMSRSTQNIFKEILGDCARTGRLRPLDENVVTQSLGMASHGIIAMTLFAPDGLEKTGDEVAPSLIEALIRGYQK